jgi:quercetin dioxygenase-like cupin family protein
MLALHEIAPFTEETMKRTTRRVVTGHDANGKARFSMDTELEAVDVVNGLASFTLLWTTATVPADNMDEMDGALRDAALTLNGGSVIRIVDFKPGTRSPMHRSNSIDYGIVLEGELQLELDGGEVKDLFKGDIVVQRGTNHAWIAHPEHPSRMAFVLIEAPPVEVNGKPLDEFMEPIA